MSANELQETLVRLAGVVSKHEVSCHLTGGIVSAFYGEPRFTQDIDLVIKVSSGPRFERFLSELSQNFIVESRASHEALRKGGMFQALDKVTMIKVDFHVGELVPNELSRSKSEEILPGLTMPIVSREDAVLSKLVWVSRGSHKSRQDVKLMLKLAVNLDRSFLKNMARELGVQDLLDGLENEINSENRPT